ncbi:hypothetical protein [Mangrovicoccus ximenensis]|uniref:hypothetical protein n=1 Tax=Mangrovicoccus ximenensis TaxID=1911570 RepID=UPI00191BCC13|nr:hypothetical protein [Mangrovicoccus ximenensis]
MLNTLERLADGLGAVTSALARITLIAVAACLILQVVCAMSSTPRCPGPKRRRAT